MSLIKPEPRTGPHPNDMTHWDTVACRRGCSEHWRRELEVRLGGPTGYRDLAPIPDRLARSFHFGVWDTEKHPVDGGPYCPAHDAVSETIASHGVWEPQETIIVLSLLAGGASGRFVDFGAQIGWFTCLALQQGAGVTAVECDADNATLLRSNASRTGYNGDLIVAEWRLDASTPVWPAEQVRLAKVDVEGAELDAIRVLEPSIREGLVDFLLVEVSPVFHGGYPALVAGLVADGFDVYRLPPKQHPAVRLDDLASALAPYEIRVRGDELDAHVSSWHQENLLFARQGASW